MYDDLYTVEGLNRALAALSEEKYKAMLQTLKRKTGRTKA